MKKLKTFAYYFGVALVIFVVVMLGVLTGYKLGAYAIDNQKDSSSAVVEDFSASSSARIDTTFISSTFGTLFPGFTNTYNTGNWSALNNTGDRAGMTWRFALNFQLYGNSIKMGLNGYYNSTSYLDSVINQQLVSTTYDGLPYYMTFVDVDESNLMVYAFGMSNNSSSARWTWIAFSCYVPTGAEFVGNIVSVSMGAYNSTQNPLYNFSTDYYYSYINTGYYNWVSFKDISGIVFSYYIPVYYVSTSSQPNRPYWYYLDSTYYLYDGSTGDNSDNYYQQGYENGYNEGYQSGNQSGYNGGYYDGYNIGYNDGFDAGEISGGNYTFLGLMGAVVDAPIQAFRGLFNVNILGINMADFLAGLLTLAVVLCVVKFVFLK